VNTIEVVTYLPEPFPGVVKATKLARKIVQANRATLGQRISYYRVTKITVVGGSYHRNGLYYPGYSQVTAKVSTKGAN
jgi:hypothetical protein